jgi:hypothetical protein
MAGFADLMEEVLEDGPYEAEPGAFAAAALDAVQAPTPAEAAALPVREAVGFALLRELLDDPRPFADENHRKKAGRFVRQTLHSSEFEKAVLDPTQSAVWRLRRLTDFQRMARLSDLRPRDREEAVIELDRGGMRILWSLKLVEKVMDGEAPVENKAAALLWLIADGILPTGACARSALEPAKQLLQSEAAHLALAKSAPLRDQILDLLASAEARRVAA